MKKSILISTFLLMLALAAYSQNAYVCQPDTILLLHDRSIIDEGDSMFLFNTYDTEGFFIQCKEHYEDDGMKGERNRNIPSIQIKTEYEYDLNHNISKMRKRWYSGPRPGMYESHYTYQDDKLLLYTRYYIDFMGDSSIEDSVLYFYDDLGRIQKEITYDFLSQYSKHANYVYEGNKVEITTEGLEYGYWGDWVMLNRETKTFGEDSILINITLEPYGKPTISETYSYDGTGRVLNVLTQVLDSLEWINSKLIEYHYDQNGYLNLAEIKTWQNGLFVSANRALYELNNIGYPTIVTFEKWNGERWEEGTWKSGFYVFSENYLKRQNDFICRKDAKRIEIHYANTPMPNYYMEEFESDNTPYTLYPNPTIGQVTITGKDLKTAEVFNTLGQCVATVKGEGEQLTVDISDLPAGVYFVNITDSEGRKCVRKVVKE